MGNVPENQMYPGMLDVFVQQKHRKSYVDVCFGLKEIWPLSMNRSESHIQFLLWFVLFDIINMFCFFYIFVDIF